ncbi:MAG: DoxX family protein [Balneolaceae bacterium]
MAISEIQFNKEWLVNHRHYAIEFLRIFLGGLLFIKGYFFIENITEIYSLIEESMQISSFVITHYVAMAHLVGGLMLAFGLLTRLAAFVQLPVLIGAAFFVHDGNIPFVTASEFEYSLVVLILLLVFFVYGGGKWSLDHQIIRKKEKAKQ